MERKKVSEIVVPLRRGVPPRPAVGLHESITRAVELMLRDDLKELAVVHNQRPIGMVRLSDAFRQLGLPVTTVAHAVPKER